MLNALASQNPGQQIEVYRAAGRGGIPDFWQMLTFCCSGDDLLALEDDVITARNFIRYVAAWRAPHVTSFFFMCGGGLAPGRPEDPRTFGYNQALWFPAHLLKQIAAARPPATARFQDDALGAVLAELGEKVIYHRSLVQHEGTVSICQPGRTLEDRRAPDFVGVDFDCLSLLATR